ncbi:DedA family protein [Candidatus Pacearchaeota archaeon]|nr:DedA family protein [Candidatus Pacearchaeota archaeon]
MSILSIFPTFDSTLGAFLQYPLYRILFFITMFESSPLFGMIVPGQLFIMLAGFLAEFGLLSLPLVIIFASLAAVFGDIIAYLLGKIYGPHLIIKFGKYLLITREQYLATEHSLINHPLHTLALGRFSATTRTLVFFIAGTRHIRFYRWIFFSLISGILWASAYATAGYLFAHTYENLLTSIDIFAMIGAVIVVLFLLKGYLKKKLDH